MWSKEITNYFEVTVEERQGYGEKLEVLYAKHGKEIQVKRHIQRDLAFMQVNHTEGTIGIFSGRFWNEKENLCPVIAMAHELGHYMDLKENFNFVYSRYNGTLGVLRMEVRAWEYGLNFLKEIGFSSEHMKVAYEYALECLKTYFFYPFPHDLDNQFEFEGTPPTYIEAQDRLRKLAGLNPVQEEETIEKPSVHDWLVSQLTEKSH